MSLNSHSCPEISLNLGAYPEFPYFCPYCPEISRFCPFDVLKFSQCCVHSLTCLMLSTCQISWWSQLEIIPIRSLCCCLFFCTKPKLFLYQTKAGCQYLGGLSIPLRGSGRNLFDNIRAINYSSALLCVWM